MECQWKASGRPVEGQWKAGERPVEGQWKASERVVDDQGMTSGELVPTIGTGDFMLPAPLLVPGGTSKRGLNGTVSVLTELCPVLFAPHPHTE